MEITYEAYYLIQNELFPTQIRSLAILLVGGANSISKVLIPLVSNLNNSNTLMLPFSFIVSGAFIFVMVR